MTALALTDPTRIIAGIVFVSLVTVEFGGYFMTKIVRGQVPMTEFQKSFARAGHAHAGVLVTLGLVGLILVDAAGMVGFFAWVGRLGIPLAAILMSGGFFAWVGRLGIPLAAILMSGGFFASSAGRGVTQPNRAIIVLWLGAACLAAGALALGVGLLTV